MKQSLFERYGGFSKVSRIVMSFYDRVLESPIASPYFEGANMRRLIDHQTKFISSLMGGPASYSNEHLERVHSHLKISEEAFYETADLLMETLEDFDFAEEDIHLVREAFVSRRHHIISRSSN